ncbi:hypothetical protein [Tahibacter caeni]|uniref:hypothetical protein n=1 Tax=Tahibacter caeni TaxID=1453545 RepID=UPI002148E8FB|nr:hypothetical protein [Tahibacter caeni]
MSLDPAQEPASRKVFFADFNHFAEDGLLWLDYPTTHAQLRDCGLVMALGLRLTVSDGDVTADVVVSAGPAGGWRGRIVSEMIDRS